MPPSRTSLVNSALLSELTEPHQVYTSRHPDKRSLHIPDGPGRYPIPSASQKSPQDESPTSLHHCKMTPTANR
ncbi:hypothetical protein BJ508DRAFT_111049 [Ascobolus immersus RN42]|uniref:Uncharacterized protein n=1 Tax=Ascobolus immersus RN42 TaxID=1160509 RepID=A0A3N4I7T7_ASCIM|nr:hypothetical protein BJ508DRAFT_111049 [Ascobolus immersus RN42]